jgi:ribosomal protein L16 Arg81 hydroxylase
LRSHGDYGNVASGVTSSIRSVSRLLALGADGIPHRNTTLFSHLIGTCRILEEAGYGPDTCAAGLFHSIYGTSVFSRAPLTLADRDSIVREIGPIAERLVWLFCSINRNKFAETCARGEPYSLDLEHRQGPVTLSRSEVEQLAAILWANHFEQSAAGEPTPDYLDQIRQLVPLEVEGPARVLTGTERPTVTVDDLFGMPASELLSRYWPTKLCVAHGNPKRFKRVFPDRVDEISAMNCAYITAFFRNGEGDKGSIDKITSSQARSMHSAGMTIYFHSLWSRRLAGLINVISNQLGLLRRMTRVSCFASRRGVGIPMHYDLNDNIVIQVRGSKRWRLAENTSVKFPTVGFTLGRPRQPVHRAEAPRGFPDRFPDEHEVVELQPGSVMFVPRGYWHDCETTDHESIHFNIQLGLPTWKDLLAFAAQEVLTAATVEMREGVTHAFSGGVLKTEHRQRLLSMIVRSLNELTEDRLAFKEAEFDEFGAKLRGSSS